MALDQNIGMVTAYAYAVSKGYTGTEEEFAQAMANAGITLESITEAVDAFINTTVPSAVQSVTTEGNTQVTRVTNTGTAQVNAVNTAGETKVSEVNTAGDTNVSAVNSAGATQVQAVNTAGSTQVGNVNTAGTTQVGAVQAKGQEVIASIPQDYSELTAEVDDLKSALSEVNAFVDWSVETGKLVRASDGAYVSSSPYNAYEYPVYGLSKVYLTPYFTNATYGYAFYDKSKNFISNSGGTYDVATRTEITVPNGAYYIRFTENTGVSKPKLEADWGLMLETKADIKETKDHSAEVYADVYKTISYTSADGLEISGKYYDLNGVIQSSVSFSTSGIVPVPYGVKDIYYYAYKNPDVPTMLFFDDSMNVVGSVIASEQPSYGNTYYSGYATIPSSAVYYELSFNTVASQVVNVRYSKLDNNAARITELETDPLYGKKITCTGDSITSAIHSVPYNGYVAQIANAHGMTIDNQAIWGAVFPQNKLSNGEPRGCIYDTIALMDASADIVVISGGINDAEYYADSSYWGSITGDYDDTLDTETFCGALEAICKEALQKWSGKPIIFVFEHRMTLDNTTYGAHFNDVQYPLMVEILQKWGIPFVDLYHEMPSLSYNEGYKTAYTTGDGVHPNYDGYAKFYVPRVYSKIKEVMGI